MMCNWAGKLSSIWHLRLTCLWYIICGEEMTQKNVVGEPANVSVVTTIGNCFCTLKWQVSFVTRYVNDNTKWHGWCQTFCWPVYALLYLVGFELFEAIQRHGRRKSPRHTVSGSSGKRKHVELVSIVNKRNLDSIRAFFYVETYVVLYAWGIQLPSNYPLILLDIGT